ncbi:MAG: hypothetical protein AVDCRST_MAG24-473, partial [uncultured Nocardioidaceae bacterium]
WERRPRPLWSRCWGAASWPCSPCCSWSAVGLPLNAPGGSGWSASSCRRGPTSQPSAGGWTTSAARSWRRGGQPSRRRRGRPSSPVAPSASSSSPPSATRDRSSRANVRAPAPRPRCWRRRSCARRAAAAAPPRVRQPPDWSSRPLRSPTACAGRCPPTSWTGPQRRRRSHAGGRDASASGSCGRPDEWSVRCRSNPRGSTSR